MQPLFVVIEDVETHAAARYAFIKSPVRIGRSELNDLPLPLPFVSSWHGVLQFDDEEVRYVDLGSTNGSSLDGTRLPRNVPAAVRPEAELRIGTLRLRFERQGVPGTMARPVTSFDQRLSQLVTQKKLRPQDAAQAAPRAPPAPDPEDARLAEEALANAAMDLDLAYASYRCSWEAMRSTLSQALTGLAGGARAQALAQLARKYDALAQEQQFRALSGAADAAVEAASAAEPAAPQGFAPGDSPVPGGGPTTALVAAFAQSYLPEPDDVATPRGAQRLLARTAEVLETFGTSYLELRRGHQEFGREMGLRVATETKVQRAQSPRELLAYLLDLRGEGRGAELQRAFADLMLHQVALLNGVVEGAKGILEQLDPVAIGEAAQGVWPLRAGSHWRAYEEKWHEIADEEEAVSAALFGPAFARAYLAVAGQREGGKSAAPGEDVDAAAAAREDGREDARSGASGDGAPGGAPDSAAV